MAISAAPLSPDKVQWLNLYWKADWRDYDMIHACASACLQASRNHVHAYVNQYISPGNWTQTTIDQLVADYCLSI